MSLGLIALGTACLFILQGYFAQVDWGTALGAIAQYGHLQIADPKYFEGIAEGYEHLISEEDLVRVVEIVSSDPAYVDHTARLTFTGLLGNSQKNWIFLGTGVESESGIASFRNLLVEGDALYEEDYDVVLLGTGLAKALSIFPKDLGPQGDFIGPPLVVFSSTTTGQYNASNLFVSGLVESGQPQVDGMMAIVPLAFAQDVMNTRSIENLILQLETPESAWAAQTRIAAALESAGIALQVKTWEELAIFREQLSAWFGGMYHFVTVVVFLLVFVAVLEVMTMSFMERMQEIGTIRAIGTQRRQIFKMFSGEALILGLFGGLIGLCIGWLIGAGINGAEIRYLPPGSTLEVPLGVLINYQQMLLPFGTAIAAATISMLFPAIRAARVNVVDALAHV